MTTFDGSNDDSFDVSPSSETVASRPEFEGANVCRLAALSTRLSDDAAAVAPLGPEFRLLGFSDQVIDAEVRWQPDDPTRLFAQLPAIRQNADEDTKTSAWRALNETATAQSAIAFLTISLGSPLERESAAAAAALWRQLERAVGSSFPRRPRRWWYLWDQLYDLWDENSPTDPLDSPLLWPWPGIRLSEPSPGEFESVDWDAEAWSVLFRRVSAMFGDPYVNPLLIALLVRWRMTRALRSPDPVTVSLAMSAFEPGGDRGAQAPAPPSEPPKVAPGDRQLVTSTMIHGTWGWKGDWWRPDGQFHTFIRRHHRPNLYGRGARFSWSGALSEPQRIRAAADFCDWASEVAPEGLQTVFGHSYGGEVASRAAIAGAGIRELVLLSVPVTSWVEAAQPWCDRVVDIRLRFDPVLALAQTRQRIARPGANTTTVLLNRWRYAHGATHEERIWHEENIAERAQL